MNKIRLIFFALIFLSMASCNKDTDSNALFVDSIYFNSFESEEDLIDFIGIFNLVEDVPEGAGDSSLLVSGGCIAPHLYVDLGPFDDEKILQLDVVGKNTSGGNGYITMYALEDYNQRAEINISDDEWTAYTSSTITLAPNTSLRIEFLSGGFVASTTLYDEVSIIQL